MCLGIPGEVLEIDGERARAEFRGVEKWVRIDVVGADLSVGDYVLNHAGFAIRKIPKSQVDETVALYEEAAGPLGDGTANEAGTGATSEGARR